MSEYDYETTFTFRKPNHFWNKLNKEMNIQERSTLNDSLYHLLLFSSLPTDFNTCVDTNGCLKDSATGMTLITSGYTDETFHLGVEWLDNGENGFNLFLDEWENNSATSLEDTELVDVNISINNDTTLYVKGVALAKVTGSESSSHQNYIVAYARASTPIKCENFITLMKGSSFVGHSSCKEL